jgi:hypothetical protein
MATEKTSPENLALINAAFTSMEEQMSYLYSRWQDELEHEDFADYEANMKANLLAKIPKAEDVTCSKKPFGITFSLDGKKYQFKVTSKSYEWKRVG